MRKVEVKAFKQSYCDKLLDELSLNTSNIEDYNEFQFENEFAKGSTGIYFNMNIIEKLDLTYGYGERGVNQCDINNSRLIYDSIKFDDGSGPRALSPLEASDRRIWTYLAFSYFFPYMKKRWAVGDVPKRYFMPGKRSQLRFEYLVRHGISRLWWMSHLILDKDNKADPLHLLDTLLLNTDVAVSLLERRIGHNRKVLLSHLNVIKSETGYQNENVHREVVKSLLATTGTKELTILKNSELTSVINEIAKTKL